MDNTSHLNGSPICLLDDDPSVLRGTSRLLSSAGWSVQPFNDPRVFLTFAESRHPLLVVLDISMPLMPGLEVQKRLRDVSPKTKVIVMTGKDDPAIRSNAMSAGAAGFLIKPVVDEELLSGIETVLGQPSQARLVG